MLRHGNDLAHVRKQENSESAEKRHLTHVIKKITHVNGLKNQRQRRKVNYARYKGDNARNCPPTNVSFMLTYVRYCFRRIRVFDD